LIISAIVVVLRIVVERAGASDALANILSVVVLHSMIGPVYFAILIARSAEPSPYIFHWLHCNSFRYGRFLDLRSSSAVLLDPSSLRSRAGLPVRNSG